MVKYLVRLDDASPYMDIKKWGRIERILDKYSVKPLVGIIPNNEDIETMPSTANNNFWTIAQLWEAKNWSIALHGYNHVYTTEEGGLNPIHKRSEFAGLSLDKQVEKIKKGYEILIHNQVTPKIFFAPSHTFDNNTLEALKISTPIRLISDTWAFNPYYYNKDFIFIPCQMGSFRKMPYGYWTFCFHPNNMDEKAIIHFDKFIQNNIKNFISFAELPLSNCHTIGITDKFLQVTYLSIRKLKG